MSARQPGGKKRQRRSLGPSYFDNLQELLKHYILIHGTDYAWDEINRMRIRIPHMRLSLGQRTVQAWLEDPERRTVLRDNVVFDPTEKVDLRTHVNLFDGFALEPKAGDCSLILEVLMHLCNRDENVYTWVLRWIALPLQRPGTKLVTSLVFHGEEGSGKNLFWSAVRQVYGRYSTMIGQAQLESQFNGWVSAMLLVIGNEVLSRREKWELRGVLKQLVSEGTVFINEKNLPAREERNHANLVLLSNENQPVVLGAKDRRFVVLESWAPHPGGKAFYAKVEDQIRNGGDAALFHCLLNLDLGDFHAHSPPIDTPAKRELIELGKDEPLRFVEQWIAGNLDLPLGAAASADFYKAFKDWCIREGERHPVSGVAFARIVKRQLDHKVLRVNIKTDGPTEMKQRTVYWHAPSVPDSCEDLDAWLRDQFDQFRHRAVPPTST